MCQHCNKFGKTVDHLATRCEKMLDKSGHQNKNCLKIRNNRPDIFILDKKKNKITLIEVGITSQDSLQIVETEKLRKYDLLANELGLIYKCSIKTIPYVMTWDGIVTKYHKS
ncbi:hypothetical protein CWI36_1763p0010, partial [Hamiltosporidium magnivora]